MQSRARSYRPVNPLIWADRPTDRGPPKSTDFTIPVIQDYIVEDGAANHGGLAGNRDASLHAVACGVVCVVCILSLLVHSS